MRKRFDDAVTEIGEIVGLDTANITAHKTRVQRWINDVRNEIAELPYDFQALRVVTQIRTFTYVTAGTIAVSADGVEVSGTSTTFTKLASPYQQWWLSLSSTGASSPNLYRVRNVVSDTKLILEVPFANTATGSVSSLNYWLFRRFYPLPYNLRKITIMNDQLGGLEVLYRDPNDFQYIQQFNSFPTEYTIRGNQDTPVETIYTGVDITAGSRTGTANASLWDDNIGPGDELRILSTSFTIKRILSSAAFELVQMPITTTGNTTATARQDNQYYIEFSPNPDQNDVMTIVGYQKIFPLSNDGDTIEEGWWEAVRAGAILRGFEYLKRPLGEKEGLMKQALARLIRNNVVGKNKTPRLIQYTPRRYSRYF